MVVAEVTTTVRGIPVEVEVGPKEGMRRRSVVNLDNLYAVPRGRLRSRIGQLARPRHAEVKRALGYAFDWPELKHT